MDSTLRCAAGLLALSLLTLAPDAGAAPSRPLLGSWSPGALPSPEVQLKPRGVDLKLSAYPGGRSLAAWKAAPRGPLAVLLGLPMIGTVGFLSAHDWRSARAPAPETCVPMSYNWDPVVVRWERLLLDKEGPIWEEYLSSFDPRLCKTTTTQRAEVHPTVLHVHEGEPLLAYRQGDDVIVLAPRRARVVADEPKSLGYGALTRVRMSPQNGARRVMVGVDQSTFVLDLTEERGTSAPLLLLRRDSSEGLTPP